MASNDGFIEFISPQAFEQLKKADLLVSELATKIASINSFTAPKSPSGADTAVKQQIADLKAQEQAIKQATNALIQEEKVKQQVIATEIKQSNAIKANIAQREAQRKATLAQAQDQEKANKAAEREALANQRLNSAYNQLTASKNKAAKALQDLIVRGKLANQSQREYNKELKGAQILFDNYNKKVKQADAAIGKFSSNVGNYKSALSGVSNLMGAFGIATGLYLGADIVKNIFNTTKELQSLNLALLNVSESQDAFNSNQAFLGSLANKYGIEIKGLTKNFTDFLAASKGLLSQRQIEDIFTSVSKSAASMGLSVESTDSAFLALEQMMSKGTIQAEELKKQLGNALPGAMRAAAMAYMELHPEITKVAEAEKLVMSEMKKGAIDSATYIPLIVKQFEILYGIENITGINTLQASVNRLSNSWTNLIKSMNESDTGGISVFFRTLTDMASGALNNLERINSSWDSIDRKAQSKGIEEGKNVGIKALDLAKKQGQDVKEQAKYMKENAEAELKLLEEKLKLETEIINKQAEKENTIGNRVLRGAKTMILGPLFPGKTDYVKLREQRELLMQEIGYQKGLISEAEKEITTVQTKIAPKKTTGTEKLINIQDKLLKEDFDMSIKMLEIARKFQEEIFTDEEKTYAERLAAREIYSKISLDLIDAQYNREIQIEKDKAEQLLKNQKEARDKDLKSNEVNVKNGFADKKIEIENRYAENVKTINYNLSQDLYKIDLNYLEKSHELQSQDLEFFKKIQKEKDKLTKETAKIYFEMAQERRLRDANDENRSLTQRQASFESWRKTAEAQLFFEEAAEKSLEENRSPEKIAKITAEYAKLRQAIKDTISPLQEFAEETRGWLSDFTSSFASDLGFSQTFKILQDDFFTNIGKAFDEGLITQEEKYAAYFNAITEMAQEAYNFLNQMSQRNFDAEYERLEQQKNVALLFAGESASAREEIERQYEERRKGIERREARAKQQQAIFNVAIDTAQAIMGLWVKPGFPAAIPLAVAVGALGAAQIAMIASQKIPQYWKGTDNAEGGLAWTQEKGREIITDSQGRIKSLGSDKGAELTNLSKGDKVFTAEKTAMMFDNNLNSILANNGISLPKIEVSMDAERITNEIKSLANTIASKESFSIVRDAKGERIYQRKQNERKELLNNILNVKTYGV